MANYERVAENLVRHVASGGLYLSAKIGGKKIRKALGVKNVRIGKLKRDELLLQLRANAGIIKSNGTLNVSQSIIQVMAWYAAQPNYQKKPKSLEYREELTKVLSKTLPKKLLSQWTVYDITTWWGNPEITRYSATRRNNMLGTLRKMIELAIDQSVRINDPTAKLKRIPVIVEEVLIPSKDDFHKVVDDILSQNKANSSQASQFVEFMAYSGCRPNEVRHVTWDDIGKADILITGGEGGTKNNMTRRVPIMGSMIDLLDRMRYNKAKGRIFHITPPKDAIKNSCARLELPHYTPKTFRHVFGTTCLECGVPLATVSDWMGHKDKGVTLAKVYAHLRNEHSLNEAKKVKF